MACVSTVTGEWIEPEDWTEGLGQGDKLFPQSLYESQLDKRLAP